MTHTEIVQKLIGPIDPLGDASRDDQRFENLYAMCQLVENLITEISYVARNKESYEGSVNRAGKYADEFLKQLQPE